VAALAVILTVSAPTAAAANDDRRTGIQGNLLIRTDDGLLRGVQADGVESFLGIPYAAPPVGDLRWRPPQPVARWTGLREATHYGNRCAQFAGSNGAGSLAEDCLYLNVQRPSGSDRHSRLPVFVFFHGGADTGSSDQHNGSSIVHAGRIIVVTVDYRLGVFGSLAHSALTAEGRGDSGNYTVLDQQQSLRWVRDRIADFGGNPSHVTIGGESSGAQEVCVHLSAPGSQGLFRAAVIQSGPTCFSQTLADAERAGSDLATTVGCQDAADAPGCLRGLAADVLMASFHGQLPVVTGTPTMPNDPRQNIADGAFPAIPVLIGTNRDEGRTFFAEPKISTEQDYRETLDGFFGDRADDVLRHYPWAPEAADNGFTGNYLLAATVTDSFFACGNRTMVADLAAHTSTFVYKFAHRDGPGLGDRFSGYVWGAGHASELPYLWPSFDNGLPIAAIFDRAEQRLARNMVSYWSSFVAQGRPAVRGLPRWPSFNNSQSLMSLNVGKGLERISMTSFTQTHQCAFWDEFEP